MHLLGLWIVPIGRTLRNPGPHPAERFDIRQTPVWRQVVGCGHGDNACYWELSRETQGQDTAHGQADHKNAPGTTGEDMPAVFDRRQPILPAGSQHVLRACGMTYQPDTQHSATLPGQVFAKPAHFLGCSGEPVDKQAASLIAGEEERLGGWNNLI